MVCVCARARACVCVLRVTEYGYKLFAQLRHDVTPQLLDRAIITCGYITILTGVINRGVLEVFNITEEKLQLIANVQFYKN